MSGKAWLYQGKFAFGLAGCLISCMAVTASPVLGAQSGAVPVTGVSTPPPPPH